MFDRANVWYYDYDMEVDRGINRHYQALGGFMSNREIGIAAAERYVRARLYGEVNYFYVVTALTRECIIRLHNMNKRLKSA